MRKSRRRCKITGHERNRLEDLSEALVVRRVGSGHSSQRLGPERRVDFWPYESGQTADIEDFEISMLFSWRVRAQA